MIMTITFDEKRGKTLLSYHTLFASAAHEEGVCRHGIAEAPGRGPTSSRMLAAMKTG